MRGWTGSAADALPPGPQTLDQFRRRIGIGRQSDLLLGLLHGDAGGGAEPAVGFAGEHAALDQQLLQFLDLRRGRHHRLAVAGPDRRRACEPPGSASISETITICGLPAPQ